MYVDPRLAADVALAEGLRLVGYPDGKGIPTNGYGHTGPAVFIGQKITKDQALHWLNGDLDDATSYAVHLPEWPCLDTQARRNAIIEIVFNMGPHNWTTEFPNTRRAILAKEWPSAEANLLDSPQWIHDVGLGRVSRIAKLLGDGAYPTSAASSSSPLPA